MGKDNLLSVISNATDDSIYLSDPQTYELIYLNPTACQIAGISEKDYLGRKCYQVLQGLDSPCPFCTNHLLSETRFYTWEHYNVPLGRQFMLRDRLVEYQDRLVRMEIATDITQCTGTSPQLAQLQAIDEALVMCIDTLKNGTDTDGALHSLLAYIGMFYQADQAYIYEVDAPTQSLSLTYSWLSGNYPSRHRYKFDLSHTPEWSEIFGPSGILFVPCVDEGFEHQSAAYQLFQAQKVSSLLASPLLNAEGNPIGVIGVGNPSANLDAPHLLRSVSTFIVDGIRKRSMLDRLERLSHNDTLTGLSNRSCYLARLKEFQDHSPPSLGIICLDVDGIRQANDTYGHAYGDAMLVRTANILMSLCSQDVYRVGGDQFVVLCPGIEQESFQFLTERLRRTIRHDADLSISIGSKWTQGQSDAVEQVMDADKLMGLEKLSHYHSTRASRGSFHARLKEKLTQELEGGLFFVYLQPQISLKTGQVVGAEALVRKRGSAGETVSPAMFIPYFEEEGVVQQIDFYVLECVCQTLAQWKQEGFFLPRVSVNFSRVTLMEGNFVDKVCQICRHHQVSPQQIDIEITESSSKMDIQALAMLIRQLRAIGYSVSLDDFGAHYSNLSILTTIDFDNIKLDKSLVDCIVTNEKAHAIVGHTISMGKSLNHTYSVTEGIETDEQLHLLSQMDCDVGQGYYFSRPLPIPEFCQRYLLA